MTNEARQMELPMTRPTYRIETNGRGVKVLRVQYCPVRLNWNERIEQALESSGLDRRTCIIICEPGV